MTSPFNHDITLTLAAKIIPSHKQVLYCILPKLFNNFFIFYHKILHLSPFVVL